MSARNWRSGTRFFFFVERLRKRTMARSCKGSRHKQRRRRSRSTRRKRTSTQRVYRSDSELHLPPQMRRQNAFQDQDPFLTMEEHLEPIIQPTIPIFTTVTNTTYRADPELWNFVRMLVDSPDSPDSPYNTYLQSRVKEKVVEQFRSKYPTLFGFLDDVNNVSLRIVEEPDSKVKFELQPNAAIFRTPENVEYLADDDLQHLQYWLDNIVYYRSDGSLAPMFTIKADLEPSGEVVYSTFKKFDMQSWRNGLSTADLDASVKKVISDALNRIAAMFRP